MEKKLTNLSGSTEIPVSDHPVAHVHGIENQPIGLRGMVSMLWCATVAWNRIKFHIIVNDIYCNAYRPTRIAGRLLICWCSIFCFCLLCSMVVSCDAGYRISENASSCVVDFACGPSPMDQCVCALERSKHSSFDGINVVCGNVRMDKCGCVCVCVFFYWFGSMSFIFSSIIYTNVKPHTHPRTHSFMNRELHRCRGCFVRLRDCRE